MKRSRFCEEQIIAILKEHEAGMPTAELCHRHGIRGATFYKYKAKFGGLEVSEALRQRERRRGPDLSCGTLPLFTILLEKGLRKLLAALHQ